MELSTASDPALQNSSLVKLDGLIMVRCHKKFLFAGLVMVLSVFPTSLRAETDALERFNQAMHDFNQKYYTTSSAEASQFVTDNVPEDVRRGMSNFFTNLGEPVAAIGDLAQGDADNAGIATKRFFYNLVFGYGGVVDPATDAGLTAKPAKVTKPRDIGQAICAAGFPDGPFLVLPFYGPSTVGDLFGSTLPVLAGYVALGEAFWIYRASSQVASTMAIPKPDSRTAEAEAATATPPPHSADAAKTAEERAYRLDKERYLATRAAICPQRRTVSQANH